MYRLSVTIYFAPTLAAASSVELFQHTGSFKPRGALKNLSASFYVSAYRGSPYNWTTGKDANLDGIYNDRPAGVGRNVFRSGWQYYSSAYFSYTIGVGKKTGLNFA